MPYQRALYYWKGISKRSIRISLPIEHWGRETHIPLLPNELIDALKHFQHLESSPRIGSEEVPPSFDRAAICLKQLVRLKYRPHHETLMDLYSKYDPDRDVFDRLVGARDDAQQVAQESHAQVSNSHAANAREMRARDMRTLLSEVADSLHHANYRRLSPKDIQAAVGAASHWGVRLRIQFSSFRRLQVYARGDIWTRRKIRTWRGLFRLREVEVPIYQRLVVVFWPKELQDFNEPLDPNRLHIRMFKNVPKADIDMMLPGTQIKLNWLDRGMIGIPTLWGIFMMSSKLVKSIWILAFIGTLKIVSSTFLFIAVVIATVFYGIKSIFSYSTAKKRYLLDVTRNLYYQNLDNNFGALLRIEEEAEQQELCEAILAYFILQTENRALTSEQVDSIAEDYLQRILGAPVDFDVEDAIHDLLRLGAIHHDGTGWMAKTPAELEAII